MSVDLGLYPAETSSSDEDMFTENVWWETSDNLAFVNDQVFISLSLFLFLSSFFFLILFQPYRIVQTTNNFHEHADEILPL